MAACTCETLMDLGTACTPYIGGIRTVKFKEAGVSNDENTAVDVIVDALPESVSFQTVMTFDKTKGLRYWTTDISMGVGALVENVMASGAISKIGTKEFANRLCCGSSTGWTIELATYDGRVITVSDAYVQTATFTNGPTKADGNTGVLAFQAITKDGPEVETPSTI